MTPRAHTHGNCCRPGRRQRGDVLLFTLIALLLSLIGLIFAMRDTVMGTLVTGNNLARQKNVHASDIALGIVLGRINTVVTNTGMDLPISAANERWYRAIDPNAATPASPPDTAYWAGCTAADAQEDKRCASATLSPTTSTAKFAVQASGRTDAQGCALKDGGLSSVAVYYDIFILVTDPSGATEASTLTEYKICVQQ